MESPSTRVPRRRQSPPPPPPPHRTRGGCSSPRWSTNSTTPMPATAASVRAWAYTLLWIILSDVGIGRVACERKKDGRQDGRRQAGRYASGVAIAAHLVGERAGDADGPEGEHRAQLVLQHPGAPLVRRRHRAPPLDHFARPPADHFARRLCRRAGSRPCTSERPGSAPGGLDEGGEGSKGEMRERGDGALDGAVTQPRHVGVVGRRSGRALRAPESALVSLPEARWATPSSSSTAGRGTS